VSNPIATIYAWTEGLKRIAQIEKNAELLAFCEHMQKAVDITVDDKKIVTRDMAVVINRDKPIKEDEDFVTTSDFINEVRKSFKHVWHQEVP